MSWLEQALGRDLKYVVLGEVAPPGTQADLAQTNRLLQRIGLEQQTDYVDQGWRAKVIDRDPEMIGFERPLDKVLPGFPVLRALGAQAEPHLVIEGPTRDAPVRSVVVATSRDGGFAAGNYAFYYEPNTDRERWTINPFAFFARAFGEERRPIPDVTTLAGRRMYFSQIDGDGWNNVSEIEGHREAQRVAAEVIEREAIAPFPDLPVSVALILGDIEPELGGLASSAAIAKRLYALPQVEVASHTHTHPFNWQFFENYDRTEEQRRIEQSQTPTLTVRDRMTRQVLALAKKPLPTDPRDKYVAGTDDLPRTYLRHPFDLQNDTVGAISETERLAPDGKRLRLYQWSGDTSPFEAAIRAVRKVGVRNINGGDSRYDPEYPSVSYVPPISRSVGTQRQIYAAASNENTYTNDWTGPYYGFFMLEKTLANTDSPRRLKPFDLYYHMYSGEKASALAAVRHLLEMARQGPYIPVAASEYATIADDFFGVEIVQIDLFSWSVGKRGALSTIRFDDAELLAVDFAHSDGVLGATRHNGALYVSLDPVIDRAVVTLRGRNNEQALRAGDRGAPVATLVDSRWQLSAMQPGACGFKISARGFGA
ncbi:MAG: hypothetical protein JSS20_17900, partial [Proteobacteria bacterium]|nr:hypothetical protein [Pseudomonadota bacterium]